MSTIQAKRVLAALSLGAGLGLGAVTPASAVAVFSVNHTVLSGVTGCVAACPPGVGADFQANLISGNSSTLLERQANNTVQGTGWINLTGFALNNIAVLPGASRVGVDYELWATFSYTLAPISGNFGQINSSYGITALNFSVWGQSGIGATFTAADAAGNVTPTVTAAGAQLLGSGAGLGGVAGINALGGAFVNANTSFSTTAFGSSFFVFPVPFFNLAFNEFNNTSQGLQISGDRIAVNQATGSIDFIRVPTPGSLALVGVALIGAGVVTRRRAKAA